MKFIPFLLLLSLLLASCSRTLSDSKIRHNFVGTWKADSSILTFSPNGKLKMVDGTNVTEAQWRVENGFVVQATVAFDGVQPPEAYAHEDRARIIRIDSRELVCEFVDGRQTNLFRAYKQ